jgi:hypothetical protein
MSLPKKGACFYGDPMNKNNPHNWVVLMADEKGAAIVSFTTPTRTPFKQMVSQADFPCISYDSEVYWKQMLFLSLDVLFRMETRQPAKAGAVERLLAQGRQRGLVPPDFDFVT